MPACPDGTLPDGPSCPTCKGLRVAAWVGGPWMHKRWPPKDFTREETTVALAHRRKQNRKRVQVEAASIEAEQHA